MGITNDANTACGKPLLNFKNPAKNFTLCNGCKKTASQHMIREKSQPAYFATTGWPKLELALYLKKPDGSSRSRDFDMLVPQKVKAWLSRRHQDFVDNGICWDSYDGNDGGYKLIYAPWSRGFLHPQWDGSDLSEKGALLLLEKYGEPEMDTSDVTCPRGLSHLPTLLADDSVSNTGGKGGPGADAAHFHAVLEGGTLQLLNFTTMILTTYRMLVEGVDSGDEEKEMMKLLNQLFESRLMCLKELAEAEQGLDDAVREELGLGPDVIYLYSGQRWKPLLKTVVPFPIIKAE
ncbi:Hypothetical protein NCS54_01500700 [Fusarium falciforme]|uniref:Hypothetical protein n=1 Tax=Fusarium falciforme TaxID=195108 RepID=UPI002301C546|nr:Hypothetical protein NCS54_01500700 [Fusarium falciforme]WAO97285.1 Hypothetical protein NCS54_01500700 [Fusarium falciforme]